MRRHGKSVFPGRRTLLTEASKVVINLKHFEAVVVSVIHNNVFLDGFGKTIEIGVRGKIKISRIFGRLLEIVHGVSNFSLLIWACLETGKIRILVDKSKRKKVFGVNFLTCSQRIAT